MDEDIEQYPSSKREFFNKKPAKPEQDVQEIIRHIEDTLKDSIKSMTLDSLTGFQGKEISRHFENSQEYKIKSYHERGKVLFRIYPIGKLKRLAEQKTQEVLMKGKAEKLPSMGSFERFVIHDYLKEREGIKTESFGQTSSNRHIEISPLFGRNLKKVKKRRLT